MKDAINVELGENPFLLAQRLSKTRSLFVNELYQKHKMQRFSPGIGQSDHKISHSSLPILPCRRQSEAAKSLPNLLPDLLENRVCKWLRKSDTALDQDSDLSEAMTSSDDSMIEMSMKSVDLNSPIKSDCSIKLIKEAQRLNLNIEDVPWKQECCDLLLKVNESLFPVDKNFVSYVSLVFKNIIEKSLALNPASVHINMDGYDTECVYTSLKFVYSNSAYEKITDENVASFLLLSEDFTISRLSCQCDKYLQESKTFNPLIAIQLAHKYKLDELMAMKCHEISKVKGFETTPEFEILSTEIQNKILKYSMRRYTKASKILSQLDVHLCSHHGNESKENSCCFRSATYNNVNGRTFLVKMESPQSKMMEQFDKLFYADVSKID